MMSKRILIVDDDAEILEMLTYFLSDSGYEINGLLRGDKVFDAIRNFHPDLILMDVMLSGLDGRTICTKIKSEPDTKFLPVILISGSHDLADSLNQLGAPNDFLAKPFDIEHLLYKIEFQFAA